MTATLRHVALRSLATIAFTLTGVTAAFAQSQSTELPSWRIAGWTFTPGVVLGTLYDSNVAIAGQDVNGKTQSDTLFQMEPFGQLEFYGPRSTFSSGYHGSLRRYFDLSELDSADHRAYLSWRERLSRRVTLFTNEEFAQVATTDQLELNGLPFQRTGARYNTVSAGAEARLTRSTDGMIRYENSWVDFVRKEETALTGGLVNGVRGELTHRWSDRLATGGEYGIRRTNLNEGTRQQTIQDLGAVARYHTGERTLVELSGGIAHVSDPSRAITKTGPYVKANLTHNAQRATVGLDYDRGYVPSFAFGGTNLSEEVRGYVQMPLSRNRLYIQESASWRRNDPFEPTDIARDSVWVHTVIGYTLQRWFRLEGYHSLTHQNTPVPGGQITRNLAGVQFVVSEPVRIR